MFKKIFLSIIFSLVLLTTYYLLQTTVFAQQPTLNLTVSPTLMDLTLDPGTKITQKFRIRNNSNTPLTLHIQVDKLSPESSNGQVVPLAPQKGDDSVNWITFDKTSFIANSNEWTDISFTISVPKEAAFGYYYALRIGQQSSDVKTSANTKVLGEVILPLLLNVKKEGAKSEVKLIDFKPNQELNEYLPVTFETIVKNTGNVHVKPHGNIFISGNGDKNLAILDVNPGLGNVLPSGTRSFASSWDDGFLLEEPIVEDGIAKLDKNNRPVTRLVINWNKLTDFRIGKYTAHLLLVYDNGSKDVSLEAKTIFWVFPWRITLGIIMTIIIVAVFIRLLLKWYISQQVKKYKNN